MAAAHSNLVALLAKFETISESPELYFKPEQGLSKEMILSVKGLFDFSRRNGQKDENFTGSMVCSLQELLVDNFDDEQIWQQIELQNDPAIRGFKTGLRELKCMKIIRVLASRNVQTNGASSNIGESNELDYAKEDGKVDHSNKGMMPASSSDEDDEDGGINTNFNGSNHDIDDNGDVDDDDIARDDDDINLDDDIEVDDDDERDTHQLNQSKHKRKKVLRKGNSVVDDQFFKLSEMTEFLDKMDQEFENARSGKKNREEDDEEEIDYFMDIGSEDEENEDEDDWDDAVGATSALMGRSSRKQKRKTKKVTELKYNDFFDPPDGEKRNKKPEDSEEQGDEYDDSNNLSGDNHDDISDNDEEKENGNDDYDVDDDDRDDVHVLSKHEKNQQNLKQKIAKLEKENLSAKPWQMSGETGSKVRPMNSLLEEDLNFDHTTTTAPPITEETTQDLETIIKQRIKDEAWDDVERKKKPVMQAYEYKKKQPLDQEKSKLSLSQIYEQEYLKQTTEPDGSKEEEENEEHVAIKALMTKLFTKLDALSNFHFTPKPPKPEVKIVTNTPVINMEEVAPVATSDAMLLAPEETHNKKAVVKGDAEKTDTDRKRERRAKKLKQRVRAKERDRKRKLVEKLNPGLGNKYAKKDALTKLEKESKTSKNVSVVKEDADERTLKSSSAFFSRLHDEVKQQVKAKKDVKKFKKISASTSQLKL